MKLENIGSKVDCRLVASMVPDGAVEDWGFLGQLILFIMESAHYLYRNNKCKLISFCLVLNVIYGPVLIYFLSEYE